MKNPRKQLSLLLSAALAAFIIPLGAADVFKARMLTGKAPIQPPQIDVRIEVESWTTLEEISRLNEVMDKSGIDAFISAFSGVKKGVVRFMYARGWNLPIHAALVFPTEKGKKILLFFNRQNWEPGSQFASTGRHFFMVMELKLNEKGKGEGRFFEDAQIKLDPLLGKIEMETYESAPKAFPYVQEVIKKKPGS